MSTIQQAKKSLANRYRSEEGFVGVGVFKLANREGIRVYVVDDRLPVARQLSSMASFEGFPIQVEVSGTVQAHI